MGLKWPGDFVDRLICGDCLEVMKEIPDKAADIVITDPIWPGGGHLFSVVDEYDLFARAVKEIVRITDRLIVHLGVASDPRFLMSIPETFKYVTQVWLRRVPPRYRGNCLIEGDVAYVFGTGWPRGVLPGSYCGPYEGLEVSIGHKNGNPHPAYRSYNHVSLLVARFTKEGEIIVDPFAGSGTTCVAAARRNRRYVGIDINPDYCKIAIDRLRQKELFEGK